jgi:cobalamin biosynthetic protein CobC
MAVPILHGGRLAAAQRRFPDAPLPWIDLSTGINPIPYELPPLPPTAFTRLPEPEDVAALEAAAAAAYGVADPACAVAAPGTQALIHLLPRLLPPRSVAVLSPTYAEHAAAWALAGHRVASVETPASLARSDVAVLCRPNNPDGGIVPAKKLLDLADELASRGGLLVVDEAFADCEGCSLAPALPRPGLLLLRSFGKCYGLAGVRLGFALGEPAWAARLRDALGPWAVSGPALHAGLSALPDRAWLEAAAARLARDAGALDELLAAAGCHILGGTRLFRLVQHDGAAALEERLSGAGILVRSFPARPGMIRFGLPGPDQCDRLRFTLR